MKTFSIFFFFWEACVRTKDEDNYTNIYISVYGDEDGLYEIRFDGEGGAR